jgi:hypothetical protein
MINSLRRMTLLWKHHQKENSPCVGKAFQKSQTPFCSPRRTLERIVWSEIDEHERSLSSLTPSPRAIPRLASGRAPSVFPEFGESGSETGIHRFRLWQSAVSISEPIVRHRNFFKMRVCRSGSARSACQPLLQGAMRCWRFVSSNSSS